MNRLNFAENFNAQGSVKGLESFLGQNLAQIHSYPDHRYGDFLNSISRVFQIPAGNIAVGAGTTEILFTLPNLLRGRVLIIAPTFWEYSVSNTRAKNKIQYYVLKEENGFEIDLIDFQKRAKKVDVVYLCNPNNPTSTLISKDKLLSVIKKTPETSFVLDETYMVFRDDYDDLSLVREAAKIKNLYVLTSFSKIFSIPGLRSGFVTSSRSNIKKFKNFLPPYSCNSLAVLATIYCLQDKQFLKNTRVFYKTQRPRTFKTFSTVLRDKLKVFPPHANFLLVKVLSKKSSTEIIHKLEEHNILARDCIGFFGLGKRWMRFTIGKNKENNILLATLKKVL